MLGAAPEPTPTIGPDEALTPLKPSAGHTAKASPVPTKTAADRPAERDILSSAEHASTPPTAVQTHTPLPTSSTPIATAAPRSQVTADQVPVVTPLDAQTEAPSPPIDTGTWRDEKKVSELQSANPALPEAAIEQLQPEEADDVSFLSPGDVARADQAGSCTAESQQSPLVQARQAVPLWLWVLNHAERLTTVNSPREADS